MTNFMRKRFSVSAPINDAYADNYERTFGKKPLAGLIQDSRPECTGNCPRAEAAELEQYHLQESLKRWCSPVGPKISIARAELEKWIERLEAFQVEHRHRDVSFVVESMKLILKADRITDPEARKK